MINRKKKRDYSEIEELLSDNKKATEIFKRIQKREEQARKKITFGCSHHAYGNYFRNTGFGFLYVCKRTAGNCRDLSFDSYVPFRLCNTIFTRKRKNTFRYPSILNEFDFINSILKEEGKCEETEVIQSGEQQYIEVHNGKDMQLVCIDDGSIRKKIASCLVCYYKNIELSCDYDCIFVKDMYRIFVKYQEQTEPKLLKENVQWG